MMGLNRLGEQQEAGASHHREKASNHHLRRFCAAECSTAIANAVREHEADRNGNREG
jgi:hypothetical protein